MNTEHTIQKTGDILVDTTLPLMTEGARRAFFALCGRDMTEIEDCDTPADVQKVAEGMYSDLMRDQVGATIPDIAAALDLHWLMSFDDQMVARQVAYVSSWDRSQVTK